MDDLAVGVGADQEKGETDREEEVGEALAGFPSFVESDRDEAAKDITDPCAEGGENRGRQDRAGADKTFAVGC